MNPACIASEFNKPFCAKLFARTGHCFCNCPAPVRVTLANEFNSYELAAAYARENGGRVRCTTVQGGPRRFMVD